MEKQRKVDDLVHFTKSILEIRQPSKLCERVKVSLESVKSDYKPAEPADFSPQKELGKGGHGYVWKVWCERDKKPYAVKRETKENTAYKVEKHFNERELGIKLDDHFFLPLVMTFQTAYHVYFVFEYTEYGNLLTHLPYLTNHDAAICLAQICHGLHYLHQRRILHRDIKLDNILVGADQKMKISDFGLSLTIPASDNTCTDGKRGPLIYMAPETLPPPHVYSFSSDVWALGAAGFELFTKGKRFCNAKTLTAAYEKTGSEDWILSRFKSLSYGEGLLYSFLRVDPSQRINLSHTMRNHSFWQEQNINYDEAYTIEIRSIKMQSSGFSPKKKEKFFVRERFETSSDALLYGLPYVGFYYDRADVWLKPINNEDYDKKNEILSDTSDMSRVTSELEEKLKQKEIENKKLHEENMLLKQKVAKMEDSQHRVLKFSCKTTQTPEIVITKNASDSTQTETSGIKTTERATQTATVNTDFPLFNEEITTLTNAVQISSDVGNQVEGNRKALFTGLTCVICKKSFTTTSSLKRHLLMVHGNLPPMFSCHMCSKKFKFQDSRNEHINSHLKLNNHQCSKCAAKFSRRSLLSKHQKKKHSK